MNISISILTWNDIEDTKILMESLVDDYYVLDKHYNVFLNICDNGSKDGTVDFLKSYDRLPINLILLETNMGINISKNILIEEAIKQNSEYMFVFDHDLAIIKGSMIGMLNVISKNDSVGCFGQHIDFYTKDKNSRLIAECFPYYEDLDIKYNVLSGCGAVRPWPHYSVYKTEIFKNGVRFDINGPFSYPGYGFDDDDLGMQITEKGYDVWCFVGLYCYHNINYSITNLKEYGFPLGYKEREKYFLNKWAHVLEK